MLRIEGGRPLRGSVRAPADAAVAERALLLCALADGTSRLRGVSANGRLAGLCAALRALGVDIAQEPGALRVAGVGLRGLRMPEGALDCGTSFSTLAMLAAVVGAQRFGTRLHARGSAATRSVEHLVGALRARGAHIAGTSVAGGPLRAPLSIAPLFEGEGLLGLECALPEPDADTKGALLISGLFADAPTAISEPLLSADHTERLLTALGVPIRRFGSMTGFDPAQWSGRLPARELDLPGSPLALAAAAAVATCVEGSHIAMQDVGLNPTTGGFLDALRLLGGHLLVIAQGDRAGHEPVGEVQVRTAALRGGAMGGEVTLRTGDALPALLPLATRARRGLAVHDGEVFARPDAAVWAELRELVAAFGMESRVEGAGLVLATGNPRPARVDARNDARLALTAVLFGLVAEGVSLVDRAHDLDEEYPGLLDALRALGASISEVTT